MRSATQLACLLALLFSPVTLLAETTDQAKPIRTISQRLADQLDPVILENVPAREAFNWFAQTTGVPMVIDWRELERQGIDPDMTISLRLRNVPANKLLQLMATQLSDTEPIVFYQTPWYVQMMSKTAANAMVETRVYDVRDILISVPNFRGPELDLRSALNNTGNQSGADNNGGTIFPRSAKSTKYETDKQRGEDLASLLRDTIEPDIWVGNGGEKASVSFYRGRLVVKAPVYIHEQIGLPMVKPNRDRRVLAQTKPTAAKNNGDAKTNASPASSGDSNVAGVSDVRSVPAAGIRNH